MGEGEESGDKITYAIGAAVTRRVGKSVNVKLTRKALWTSRGYVYMYYLSFTRTHMMVLDRK